MSDHKLSPTTPPGVGKISPAVSPTGVIGQNVTSSTGSVDIPDSMKVSPRTGVTVTATVVRPHLHSPGATSTATMMRPHPGSTGSTTTIVRPHLTVSVAGSGSPAVVRPHLAVNSVAAVATNMMTSSVRPHIPVQLCPERQVQVIQRPVQQVPYSVATQLPVYAHQQVLLQGLPHGTIAVPQQIQGMTSPPLSARSPTGTNAPGNQPSIAMLQQVVSAAGGPTVSIPGHAGTTAPSNVNPGSLNALTATVNALQPTVTSIPQMSPGGQHGKFPGKTGGSIVIGTSALGNIHGKLGKPMMGRHGPIRGPHGTLHDPKQHVIITTQTPIFVRPQRQPAITAQPPMQTSTVVTTQTLPRHNIATVMVPPQTSVRHMTGNPHKPQQIVVTAQSLGQPRIEKRVNVNAVKHLHTMPTTLTIPNPAKLYKLERSHDMRPQHTYRQQPSGSSKLHKKPEPTKVHPQPQTQQSPLLTVTVTPTPTSTTPPTHQPPQHVQQQHHQPPQNPHNATKAEEKKDNKPTNTSQDQLQSSAKAAGGNHGNGNPNKSSDSNVKNAKEREDEHEKEQNQDGMEKPKEPQKAVVRPQVLTHIIEGFVIEEAKEPFPVSKSALLADLAPSKKTGSSSVSSDQESLPLTTKERKEKTCHQNQELLKCEFCGKMDIAQKFKRSKRFCSMACAKRYNVGCSKRLGLFKPSKPNKYKFKMSKKMAMTCKTKGMRGKHGRLAFNIHEERLRLMDEDSQSSQQTDSTPSPETPPNYDDNDYDMDMDTDPIIITDPKRWSVDEVADFIRSLPGCSDYADEFQSQEIDGQALLLLKEDHLMSAMNMKLGPALKICARINSLKD
ncbi:uncharacterized protein LOC144451422 [Glandiceps talaboti]